MSIPDTRLQDIIPTYERHLRALGRRERGIARYLDHLRGYLATLPESATSAALTPESVREHMRNRAATCAPATVLGMLTAVRSFCQFLVEEGALQADPTTRVRWPKRKHALPRSLSSGELTTLVEALRMPDDLADTPRWYWQRNRRAIYIMLYAGLRLSEVAALLWRDVDMMANTIIVCDGKGGKARIVTMHRRLKAELLPASTAPAHWAVAGKQDGSALRPGALAHIFEEWLPRLDIQGISAHRLRHTFATEMLRREVPLCDIQEALGHSSIETTRIYLHVDISRIRAGIDKLPDWE
jgi:site-specific recombinase XerD